MPSSIQTAIRVCDNLDPDLGLPSLPLDSIDVTITDPPYEAEAHTKARRSNRRGRDGNLDAVVDHSIDFDPMTEELRSAVGAELARVTRRWIAVFCQVEASGAWRRAITASGKARYVRTMVWIKPDAPPQFTGDRPAMGYESIVLCYGSPGRMTWNGGGRHGVFTHQIVKGSARDGIRVGGRSDHPTQKPLGLMLDLVSLFSDPGELVLDPYLGSGTTAAACSQLGRRCLGYELREDYAEIARRRASGGPANVHPAQGELF